MASQLNIINLALSYIAQIKITQTQLDAETTTPQVKEALRVWEFALKETLRSFNWGFAKAQEALVETTDYDPAVYDYAYVYPTNCLAIRKVNVQTSLDETISGEYELMYDTTNDAVRIVTDIDDAYIEYTYYVTTTTIFDDAFVVAFSYRLAAALAVPLNGDLKQAEAMAKLAANSLSEAKRHDYGTQHQAHDANEKSNFVDARD
jgi:hypothetical protein